MEAAQPGFVLTQAEKRGFQRLRLTDGIAQQMAYAEASQFDRRPRRIDAPGDRLDGQ